MSRITKLEDKNGVVHTLGDAQVSSYEREISGSGNVVPYSEAVKKYVDSEVAGAESALEDHLDDTDNPHEVTASQVGAYSKTESDAKYVKDVVVNSAGNTITVSKSVTDKTVTFNLEANNGTTVEYGTLEGFSFDALDKVAGTIEADEDGIIVSKNAVYQIMAVIAVQFIPTADVMADVTLQVNGTDVDVSAIEMDDSADDVQRYRAVFDYDSGDSNRLLFSLSNSGTSAITISEIYIQLHRLVSSVANPVSQTDFNKLYYGTGLSSSTLASAKTNNYNIVAIKGGVTPVTISTSAFQAADTVVTESEYEEMEEEGTLVSGMRYVITEDS